MQTYLGASEICWKFWWTVVVHKLNWNVKFWIHLIHNPNFDWNLSKHQEIITLWFEYLFGSHECIVFAHLLWAVVRYCNHRLFEEKWTALGSKPFHSKLLTAVAFPHHLGNLCRGQAAKRGDVSREKRPKAKHGFSCDVFRERSPRIGRSDTIKRIDRPQQAKQRAKNQRLHKMPKNDKTVRQGRQQFPKRGASCSSSFENGIKRPSRVQVEKAPSMDSYINMSILWPTWSHGPFQFSWAYIVYMICIHIVRIIQKATLLQHLGSLDALEWKLPPCGEELTAHSVMKPLTLLWIT